MGKSEQASVACKVCGGPFFPVRKGHLYCSATCRNRLYKLKKAKESQAKKARRIKAKFKKLSATPFGRYLVRELRRAGSVEILWGHSETSLAELVRLRNRCNTVSGYDEGKPRGTYELSHIYAAQGKHGLGRLHPKNLVIAPRKFNRQIGAAGHYDWLDLYVDYPLLEDTWKVSPNMTAEQVLKLAKRYLKNPFNAWLLSFAMFTPQYDTLIRKLLEQGYKRKALVGMDLDALKELAADAQISVYTANTESCEEIEVLCEELQRQKPFSIVLATALILKELGWIQNSEEVLSHLKEKDIAEVTRFVCEQGWRELHHIPFAIQWRGTPFSEFFTGKPLIAGL